MTQKDVAKAAGVSQATVSIVLSGSGLEAIPAETVQRVNQAAEDLGYTPNRFARALRTNRTMTLACVIPDITNPYYPSLVRGVQTIAEDTGYDVIAVNSDGTRDRELHFLDMARRGRVDGLVGVFFSVGVADIGPIVERGIPVVRVEASIKSGGSVAIDDLYVDNLKAAHELTDFLLDKGHRSIAMIAGRGGPQSVRVEGYSRALQSRKLNPIIEVDDAFTEDGGAAAMARLLDAGQTPSAVIAANDLMAIGATHTLREHDIAVPDQIAVAGFDDIPAARLVMPALTTVRQFQDTLGAEAARTLLGRLDGSLTGAGQVYEYPFEIVERAST
ncbi:MAG: LacI family transcriptional regulator [Hyphomicrobiales bacterium]|nr:LacI family transcriptional regulator [Hyphomicrobiales bacterium]